MSKPRHTLYAYVEGGALAEVAPLVESQSREFVGLGGWRLAVPVVVNHPRARTPDLRADDLPSWDLGINLALPNPGEEPPGWFADVERVAAFAGRLYTQIQRTIVIGVWDSERRFSEDLFDVDSPEPNIDELRTLLGAGDAR